MRRIDVRTVADRRMRRTMSCVVLGIAVMGGALSGAVASPDVKTDIDALVRVVEWGTCVPGRRSATALVLSLGNADAAEVRSALREAWANAGRPDSYASGSRAAIERTIRFLYGRPPARVPDNTEYIGAPPAVTLFHGVVVPRASSGAAISGSDEDERLPSFHDLVGDHSLIRLDPPKPAALLRLLDRRPRHWEPSEHLSFAAAVGETAARDDPSLEALIDRAKGPGADAYVHVALAATQRPRALRALSGLVAGALTPNGERAAGPPVSGIAVRALGEADPRELLRLLRALPADRADTALRHAPPALAVKALAEGVDTRQPGGARALLRACRWFSFLETLPSGEDGETVLEILRDGLRSDPVETRRAAESAVRAVLYRYTLTGWHPGVRRESVTPLPQLVADLLDAVRQGQIRILDDTPGIYADCPSRVEPFASEDSGTPIGTPSPPKSSEPWEPPPGRRVLSAERDGDTLRLRLRNPLDHPVLIATVALAYGTVEWPTNGGAEPPTVTVRVGGVRAWLAIPAGDLKQLGPAEEHAWSVTLPSAVPAEAGIRVEIRDGLEVLGRTSDTPLLGRILSTRVR